MWTRRHSWIGWTARSLICPLGLLAFLGCGGKDEDTLQRIRGGGRMRVGTDATYPPFESVDVASGQVVGFDIDLIRAVASRVETQVEIQVVPFDGIFAGLRAGKYDVVISAVTITEERAREVRFSRPYHAAGQSIVAAIASPIAGPVDLEGKRIGVQLGTTGEIAARRVARAEVVSFDAIGAAWIDLRNGKVDAVIADTPTALLFSRQHGGFVLAGEPLTQESYGIALRMSDTLLCDTIDRILEDLDRDGTVEDLRIRWGLEGP